jgi:hypothetical protein
MEKLTAEQRAAVLYGAMMDQLEALYQDCGEVAVHENVLALVGAYVVMILKHKGVVGLEKAAYDLETVIDGARNASANKETPCG